MNEAPPSNENKEVSAKRSLASRMRWQYLAALFVAMVVAAGVWYVVMVPRTVAPTPDDVSDTGGSDIPPVDTPAQGAPLEFSTIAQGGSSAHDVGRTYVFKAQEDWEALWRSLMANRTPIPIVPEVDFTRDMVIAVTVDERPTGGYAVEIVEVIEYDEYIEARIVEVEPGPNDMVTEALTQPYHIIAAPISQKQVRFVYVGE